MIAKNKPWVETKQNFGDQNLPTSAVSSLSCGYLGDCFYKYTF